MKKPELSFSVALIPIDYAVLVLAGVSAYYLRFSNWAASRWPIVFNLPFAEYFNSLLIIAFLWIVVFALSGLYQIKSARKLAQEIQRIIISCATGLSLVAIIIFLQRDLFDSRFIVLSGFIIAILYLILTHSFIRWLQRYLFRFGIGVRKVVLVGNSKTTENLMTEFSSNPKMGYEVAKRVRDFSLSTSQELLEFVSENEVDEIIQSDPNLSKTEVLRLYDFSNDNHITYRYVADLLEVKVLRTEVSEIMGMPIVEVKKTTLDGWGRVFKRVFDIIFSSFFIILLSPIMALAALAVAIDSRGPIFFSKKDDGSFLFRVGRGLSLLSILNFVP